MSAPSLRDIEKTLTTLWLDEDARRWFLTGAKEKNIPASLKDVPLDFIKTISQDGVRLYGSLLNFGHHDVMESIYPYCKQLLDDDWENTVDDYLKVFPPDHFNFNRLCSRFSRYLSETEGGSRHLKKFPFIAELAHYEWIELEKMEEDVIIEEFPQQSLDSPETFSKLAPAVNPSLSIVRYEFPLTQIVEVLEAGGRLAKKVSKEETIVAIYRHPETHRCHFVEVGEATAQVLEKASKEKVSYQDLIPLVVSLAKNKDPHKVVVDFLDSIDELQELKVLVGSKNVG